MSSKDYLEHTCKDRTPYTYLIGWSSLNKWYYGVRYAKGCHPSDLFVSYFTSSKHVKKFIEINGNPDVVEIRKTFNSVKSSQTCEHRVLKKLNVLFSEKWLNLHNGSSPTYECAIKGARAKKPWKEDDCRRKQSSDRLKSPERQQPLLW